MRVDALTLAFRIPSSSVEVRRLFEAVQGEQPIHTMNIGPLCVRVWQGKQSTRVAFENGLCYGVFDTTGAHGWTLEIVPRALWLAQSSVDEVIDHCERFALALADGCLEHDDWGPRLRRIDLCADFIGWPLADLTLGHWMLPRNARGANDCAASDAQKAPRSALGRVYSRGATITGFTVAPGGFLMARVYDKLEELRFLEREAKREQKAKERKGPAWQDVTPKSDVERTRWKAQGWNGRDNVTRVEFQLRGRILDQLEGFKGRDPREVVRHLDAIWQYCTRWTRLVIPHTNSRLHRCDLDPRWLAVRAVKFAHLAPPVGRLRVRRGPTAAATLGNVISFLAARGLLGDLPMAGRPVRAWVGKRVNEESIGEACAELHFERDLDSLATRWIGTIKAAAGDRQQAAIKVAAKSQEAFGRFATWAEPEEEDG